MKPLVTPIANLNGNSLESLQAQLSSVRKALDHTLYAFAQASDCIHGRNFQTIAQHRAAQEAWYERTMLLNNMAKEIYDMQIEMEDQK